MKKTVKSVISLVLCILMLPIGAIQNTSAMSEKEFEKTVKNSVILYLNKENIMLYGEKSYISDNREITPYKKGDDIYLPVGFFASSIDGTVSEISDGKVKISVGKKSAELAAEKGNGDVLYAKADELCDAFSYQFYADKNGIIAYSKENLEKLFDWTENLHLLREKLAEFLFDDVSGEELYSLLLQNNPDKNHPRLLIDSEGWEKIRESKDGIYNYLKNNIKKAANTYLKTAVSKYEIRDGIRLLYVSWEASDVIVSCALMYNLTLDEKYAKRAYDEMEAVCAFPDWNPKHYLDVGVMSAGVAIGYDLIYNWMTPDQRATIRAGIEKHVIPTILEDINGCVGERTYQWYKEGNVNNWRCVCAGGVGVAMLAMIDEFEGETLENAKIILPKMLEALRPTMMLFAPYGAYEEGFGYWEFAMQNYSYFMKSLEMMTGSDFGYVDLPGMNLTHEYFIAANGPVQIFNYHTAGSTLESFYPPQLLYLADKFDSPETASYVLKRIRASKWGAYGKYDDILYYEPEMNQKFETEPLYDAYFPVTEIATMRNNSGSKATFVGLHCDRPFGNGTTGGEHMDAGQFQIQAQGQVWFMDLGSNDYNVSDLHNTYRFRAEGHNTVIFNPDYDFAMKKNGTCYISDYDFDTDYSYAVGNMTDAYNKEEGVTSFLRGIKLDKEKGYVTVQDEIRLKDSADMYWFAHTDADITLSDDKKSATLTKAGRTIHAFIVNGDAATFSVMEAKPLPTSPKVPDQEAVASNVKKLTIHIEKCKDIDLCVVFATSSAYSKVGVYEFSNISEWKKVPAAEDITIPDTTDTSVDTDVNVDAPAPASKLPVIIGIGAAVVAAIGVVATVLFKKKKRK